MSDRTEPVVLGETEHQAYLRDKIQKAVNNGLGQGKVRGEKAAERVAMLVEVLGESWGRMSILASLHSAISGMLDQAERDLAACAMLSDDFDRLFYAVSEMTMLTMVLGVVSAEVRPPTKEEE